MSNINLKQNLLNGLAGLGLAILFVGMVNFCSSFEITKPNFQNTFQKYSMFCIEQAAACK